MPERSRVTSGGMGGGLNELTDPSFLPLSTLTRSENTKQRGLVVEKREAWDHLTDLGAGNVIVRLLFHFIDKSGTRHLLAGASDKVYRIT